MPKEPFKYENEIAAIPSPRLTGDKMRDDPPKIMDEFCRRAARYLAEQKDILICACISNRLGRSNWTIEELRGRLTGIIREGSPETTFHMDNKPLLAIWPVGYVPQEYADASPWRDLPLGVSNTLTFSFYYNFFQRMIPIYTNTVSDFRAGQTVIYVPGVAEGNPLHSACERGKVSSMNDTSVFVRFDKQVEKFGWDGATSESCAPRDLHIVHIVNHVNP